VLVFLIALAAHVLPWVQYRSDPFSTSLISDALSYDEWGRRIASRGLAAEPVFHQAPLYPIVLAWVGGPSGGDAGRNAAIALQVILTSLAIAALVPISRWFVGSSVAGLLAAAIAILHGFFVFHSLKLLPVSLALATQALALAALGWARSKPSAPTAALAGVALGVAALARNETLLFAPFAVLFLILSAPRGKVLRATAFVTALLVALAPAAAHNWSQGDFVLVASSGGENLFIGNKRGGDGDYTPLHPKAGDLFSERILATEVAEREAGRALRASEVSTHWRRKAFEEVRADPVAWLRLEGKKLARVLHPGDPNDVYSLPLERGLYLGSLWLLPLPAWTLLATGGFGLWLAARRRFSAAWPLVAFVFVQVAVLLAFFVNTRLRLPFLFFLTPFGGLAVVELQRLRVEGRRALWSVATAALAVATIYGVVRTVPSPRDRVRLAAVLSIQNRLDEGLEVLGPALAADPPYPTAFDQAGWLLQKKRDYRGAIAWYRKALDADLSPGRALQTRTRLAICLEGAGELEAAAAEHDRAAQHPEANAGTFYERGAFRLRRGDRAGAADDLRHAAALDPSWPPPREALARLTSALSPAPAPPESATGPGAPDR